MCVEPLWERVEPFKGWVGATPRPQANGLLVSGQALAGGKDSGAVERGGRSLNSVDQPLFAGGSWFYLEHHR